MFRAHRPILRRIHTAVHTTIGSMAVPLGPRALYVVHTEYIIEEIVRQVG
jgi:hypothetical protein